MKSSSRRGQFSLIMIVVVTALIALGVAGFAMRGGSGKERGGQPDSFAVKRGAFQITIPVSGELAAMKQIEIRNNLDGRAVITEIVLEGKFVNVGDIVLRLNDEETRTKLRDGQDKVNVAQAALTSAQATLDIKIKARESELAKANLAIQLADLALKAWQEGEDVSKRQALALAVETAQKEFDRLEIRYKESAGLLEKKFISLDEYRRDEIALVQAKAKLEQAKLDVVVYEKYQFEESKAKKESDLKQAREELQRVDTRTEAEVRSAQSDVDSKQYQLDSAKEKLAEFQTQLSFCTVTAPSAGLVVYASSLQQGGWGRDQGAPPQVGTELTRNQVVMVLPDTSKMVAAVKISEALSGLIKPGQPATITSDALPDRPLFGEVLSVGVLAESYGWRDPNRRDYTVRVALTEGNDLGLKPSMRCKAEIDVGRVEEALHIPVQAVFRSGSIAYVYVPDGGGYSQKKVSLGQSSELYIEVLDGLGEGDIVMLREPEPDDVVARVEVPKNGPGNGSRPRGPRGNDTNGADENAAADHANANGHADQPAATDGSPAPRGSAKSGNGRGRGKPGTGGHEPDNAGGEPAAKEPAHAEDAKSDPAPAPEEKPAVAPATAG